MIFEILQKDFYIKPAQVAGQKYNYLDFKKAQKETRAGLRKQLKSLAKAHPTIFVCPKGGNGSNVEIGSVCLRAGKLYDLTIFIPGKGLMTSVSYGSIESLKFDTNEKLVIINEVMAIRYE